jgi:hypothetical protein
MPCATYAPYPAKPAKKRRGCARFVSRSLSSAAVDWLYFFGVLACFIGAHVVAGSF